MIDNTKARAGEESREARGPIEVAVVGGGCAALTAAFELTRPELGGAYHVTVYQLGWRLGGKGASGRGLADRIEEHGLHVWLGFYENAFRLLRECYAELDRDPERCPIADWRDAVFPERFVAIADTSRRGGWIQWSTLFPPADGLPGDPLAPENPYSVGGYVKRTARLLRALLLDVRTRSAGRARPAAPGLGGEQEGSTESVAALLAGVDRLVGFGLMSGAAGIAEAAGRLELMLDALPDWSNGRVLELLRAIARATRASLEDVLERDDETRYIWQIIDLVLAILTGIFRFGIVTDPRGFDAINEYECREWLKLNGASEASLDSAFVRGLFDLAMAYPGGDTNRPALAAGQAVRGALRMFFTYRGALLWKMRAGMGDVVFAPLYEVLEKRGVSFEFFHRLENVRIAKADELGPGEKAYVEALEFDVQARIRSPKGAASSAYAPLIDVHGLPCWPAAPDFEQLAEGEAMRTEQWDFESFWDGRKVASRTLRVGEDFDFVVLGVGIGAVPHVCRELVERDARWRAMVDHVETVPTQAFQIWMREDMKALGWDEPPVTLSAFARPFDTWADMSQLAAAESWAIPPRSIAYFCSVLTDPAVPPSRNDADYPRRRREEVRANAVEFLKHHVRHLWPGAADGPDDFRWQLLVDPGEARSTRDSTGESIFATQFWAANVNPSDRYVLATPGSLKYRISPLDNTYDNLTIAGDWTDCGFTEGCVEAAVMSGRLAAHALAGSPALEDIIGYDHP